MAEPFFLKKKTRKPGARAPGAPPRALAGAAGGAGSSTGTATPPRPPPRPVKKPLPRKPFGLTAAPSAPAAKPEPSDLLEFQIVSAAPGQALRYNIMKMNSTKEVDPASLPRPIMLNRKQPGPRQLPQYAIDEEGKVVGRYVFDEEGKPVLGDDGKPTIEKRNDMDMSLVGSAPGMNNKRRGKRQTKEVFHQDIDVIRLRREEANPWILESKNKSPEDAPDAATRVPEHWVGRMVEQAALPTVLLVNNGNEATFTMIPLGRTYKFEPERPFKIMDADQAHKYYEMQTKQRIHDRWGQRQESGGPSVVKNEPHYLEERAQRMEWNIMANKGELPRQTAKRERFEDDYVRENRNIGRGLEGGVDEELDYDLNDDFQDDEDSNTFYHNKEEDEDKKLQEEKQKKEYRWANYNVGDRPNIEGEDGKDDDDDDDDLFGEKLTSEGKRLRKMMRRRAGGDDEDLYESTDDDSQSSDDEDKDKESEKEKEKEKRPPGSAEKSRPQSRAGSRAPDGRPGSPSRRLGPPTPERRGVPGAGQALLAKRAASRGVSPRPGSSRAGSPLARGSSPVAEAGRSGSPGVNGRGASPALPRGSSPAPGAAREATPGALDPAHRQKPSKRKATASPMGEGAVATPSSAASSIMGSSTKRKSPGDTPSPSTTAGSPAPPNAALRNMKKRKSGSATPDLENENFPNMITRTDVLQWLRQQPDAFPMRRAVETWSKAITSAPPEYKDRNKSRFLQIIKVLTDKLPDQHLKLKSEYR